MHFKAAGVRIERARDEAMIAAWHTAALGRVKKLPALKELLSKKPDRPQTPEQQRAMLKSIFANAKRKRDGR